MAAPAQPIYQFSGFELDSSERRLLAQGKPITLTPKVFDTLVLLVERAGHVVSKDELMTAIWPRGFVHESNLTKHIWLIRKVLGDSEEDVHFIETVPKLGYRFVAPVQRIAATDPALSAANHPAQATAPPAEPTVVAPRWRRPMPLYALAGVVLVVLGVVAIALHDRLPDADDESATPASKSLAVVDFNNLSQNSKDAWLGPALVEMLGTEATLGGTVHALPDELVRPARIDLSAPSAGGYAPQSLATLHKRLGADYVLSGSYLVSGPAGGPGVRIDLALQDARGGRTVASVSRSASMAELAQLVSDAGAALREQSGFHAASEAELESVASARPPTTEVARRIGFALDALHRNDPARARDELLDAVAQAPGYAPIYSDLAQAWTALGYGAKALAAAEQAEQHAATLPAEQRAQIDAQLHLARHDWPQAEQTLRALVEAHRDNPEYRYQLVAALIAAGKSDLARDEANALTRLPGSKADDPRIELLHARVAAAREDSKERAAHAGRALQLAEQHDDPGLAAEAQAQLGIARGDIGDLTGAAQALNAARTGFRQVGNQQGEAWVEQNLGNFYFGTDADRAREAYQRALVTFQSIGNRAGEAGVYSNLARMLWEAGDRDGTEAAVRKSLAIRRETADLGGQAWNLAALGSIELDAGANDQAESDYREALALDEQAGERAHHAYVQEQYAELLRLRGDLKTALTMCQKALREYRERDDADGIANAEFECAEIALDSGDVDGAQASLLASHDAAVSLGDSIVITGDETALAQIAMHRKNYKAAIENLDSAIDSARHGEIVTGEAIAQSQLALCQAALGNSVERDRAAARTRELRSRVTEQQEVFAVDIAQADLQGRMGKTDDAVNALRELTSDADKRHWVAWSLESRLAELQALEQARAGDAPALRNAIEASAGEHGFGWILARIDDRAGTNPVAATSVTRHVPGKRSDSAAPVSISALPAQIRFARCGTDCLADSRR